MRKILAGAFCQKLVSPDEITGTLPHDTLHFPYKIVIIDDIPYVSSTPFSRSAPLLLILKVKCSFMIIPRIIYTTPHHVTKLRYDDSIDFILLLK